MSCFVITYLIGWLLFTMSIENDKMPEFLAASILIAGMNILIYVLLDRMQRDAALREEHKFLKSVWQRRKRRSGKQGNSMKR